MRTRSMQTVAIVLAGLTWGCGDSPTAKKAQEKAEQALDAAGKAAKVAGEKLEAGAEKAAEKVKEGAKEVGEAAKEGMDKVEAGAREAYEKGKEELREVRDGLQADTKTADTKTEVKTEPAK